MFEALLAAMKNLLIISFDKYVHIYACEVLKIAEFLGKFYKCQEIPSISKHFQAF